MTVPCGYRFHPRDEELLVYLKRKIHNLPLPSDIINEVELYKYDPSQFLSKGEEKCYFFTPTYRKYVNGSRPNRSTNNGYWKASTADAQIKDERNKDIGTKRTLVFYYGGPHGRKTNWIMHEYKLMENQNTASVQAPSDPMKLDEWVLCSIYENLSSDKREKRKRNATEELDTRTEKRALVIHNLPLPCDIIKEVELYKYGPSELTDQFVSKGEEKCYFFTPTYRKSVNGTRPNRTTSNGYWRASTAVTPIEDERNNEIGTKRSLVFHYGDHPHGRKSNWIMHEYKLIENQSTTHLDEWVLCSIYENLCADEREKRKRKRKATEKLDTRKEKRAIVVQQEPQVQINEYKDNDQSVVASYDNLQKEPVHDALDMGGDIAPMSDPDVADFATELMEMVAKEELGTISEESVTVVQQEQPHIKISEYTDSDQSVVSSGDNLEKGLMHDASDMSWDIPPMSDSDFADFDKLMEMMAREELDRGSEINVVQQEPQIKISGNNAVFSYDDLPKGPIDASDRLGWDIAPISDSDYANFVELMEKLNATPTHDSS
ncbi:NAC domain-containing protein [Cinnamomum micranthum f. kanehirae]|uniref:NAC domain-containing protein n=1 Tax=Cinnamomum micranthum f. kanehirae TaxID=337451 RepID=A0A3S3N3Y6_9MAGN|nr:NAC domain-containing protein [Cinnamomum micranthum f. kanehirae]